jgi:hypothetical protein
MGSRMQGLRFEIGLLRRQMSSAPQKSERVEVPHARAPVLAATEQQELAGVIVYGANGAVVSELGELLACAND